LKAKHSLDIAFAILDDGDASRSGSTNALALSAPLSPATAVLFRGNARCLRVRARRRCASRRVVDQAKDRPSLASTDG